MSEGGDWVPTITLNSIDDEYPSMVKIGDLELVVCRVDDEAFSLGNICSHAFARLSDGVVEGDQVFCPLHQGSFDLRTGAAVAAPCHVAVKSYPTRVEDGVVYVLPQARESQAA
ncbi:non-heme iron oxygenase ferredoxin subunit [Brevundimonas sp.]|uniref:non-heme iron oxygenase ferredoxin subunit n=1 Tax=Brevundimonas sp. TaxID=1871086 RepID=UPI00260CCD45|nr:non-heme iron oxygenase ferredoxin subunit [Brevundimonas sp.]